jgi:hypothetical protein
MASLDVSELPTDTPNALVLDAVRSASSTDYQLRIPQADKGGVSQTIAALMDPANRRWRNEFIESLVNRIGMVIARNNSWTNPLSEFKRGMLEFGSTIEEIQTGLLKAHNYDPDRDYMEGTLFGRERPEVQTNFHTVNRQDFYKVTVNEPMLERAFLSSTGLATFINQVMEAPSTSDNWDEFLLTCSLFAEYEENGGFYHVNVPNVATYSSGAEDAKLALRKMRAMAENLKFLSTKYNAARMPVSAKPDDLILITTPEFNAAVDVEALAAAFNLDKAEFGARKVIIPQANFNLGTECQAILTTRDFFVIADKTLETTSQWNPANMHTNHFLHHHQIISASRFVPAVMFTTGQDDEVINIYTPPTSVTVAFGTLPDGTTATGGVHGSIVPLTATVAPSGADNGVQWSVSGASALSSGTFITATGVLHIGLDEANTSLTVKAETTTVNPDDPFTAEVSGTLAVPITDGPLVLWPNASSASPSQITGITVAGTPVPAFAVGTLTYSVTTPATNDDGVPIVITPDDIVVNSIGPVSVATTVSGPTGTPPVYTATVATQNADDAAVVTYTLTITVG